MNIDWNNEQECLKDIKQNKKSRKYIKDEKYKYLSIEELQNLGYILPISTVKNKLKR